MRSFGFETYYWAYTYYKFTFKVSLVVAYDYEDGV